MAETVDNFGKNKSQISGIDKTSFTDANMYQDQTAANVKLRSAVVDYKKKSKQRKRLWRRGFSEFYDITDMKP